MNLALFDFDGTITHCDTFSPFLKKAVPPSKRLRIGKALLIPFMLGYKTGLISSSSVRQKAIYFGLKGLSYKTLKELGKQHSDEFLPNVIRENALDRIHWHLANGDRIIVVSASLDLYLQHWCDNLNLELVCNKLAVNGNILTGKYLGTDCCSAEKVRRVKSLVCLADYDKIYAYGDTKEDKELLAIADEKYYRWKKVG